jgi:hypothetical protein
MRSLDLRSALLCAGLFAIACSSDPKDSKPSAASRDGGAGSPHSSDKAGSSAGGRSGMSAGAGNGSGGGANPADSGRSRPDAASSGTDSGVVRDAGGELPDASTHGSPQLADAHPGDHGLADDPAVVWFEDFEEGSLGAIAARYDQTRDQGRWQLISDTPSGQGSALALRAGQGQDAVDLYKQLPDADEWYVRWYAKYEAGVPWHHSGVWFGGYNPGMRYPSPMAGLRPNGADRFSIALEPVYGVDGNSPRFDFYNYFMKMHSWMAEPVMDDGTAYYGNGFVHRKDFTVDPGNWVCLEVHARVNDAPASNAGAVLEVWKNDVLMQHFDATAPKGYWIRDKFCPEGADGSECTDYPAPATQLLDLQVRNTAGLRLNAFWPQNYITDAAMGTLAFDQMVVATRRVGCTR